MPAEGLAELDDELKAVKEELDVGRKTLKSLTFGEWVGCMQEQFLTSTSQRSLRRLLNLELKT
jgi:hypothetical protein